MIGKLRNTFKSVFWYAFIKDFKSHKVAFSVACIGIIYIVVFGIFGENAEPWFPYADQIDNVLQNLSYSYVAAYIFFVMTTSIKYASDKRKCYEMSKRTLEIIANRVGMFFFYAGLDVGPSNIKNWPDRKGSFNASEASLSNLDKFFKQKKLSDSTPRISPPMDYLSAIKYTYQQVLNDESRFSYWTKDDELSFEIMEFYEKVKMRKFNPARDSQAGDLMTKSLAFYYVFGSISPFYLVSAFKSLNDAFEEIYGVKAVDIEFVEVYSGEQAQ